MARLSFALLTATLSTIFILGPTVASAQFAAGYDPQCVITCWDVVLQDQSARLVDEGIFAVGQSAWCTDDTLTGALSSCWDQACTDSEKAQGQKSWDSACAYSSSTLSVWQQVHPSTPVAATITPVLSGLARRTLLARKPLAKANVDNDSIFADAA
ncbi:hypothetical protein JCM8202_000474 [Rhodotorula sphaerocarpa]